MAADACSLASENVAAPLAQAAGNQLQSQQASDDHFQSHERKPVKKRLRKMASDEVQLCPDIGMHQLCWKRPNKSDPARLCLVVQLGIGMCFFF